MAVKRIRINLATLEYVNPRLAHLMMIGAALTALVVTGCNIRHHFELSKEIHNYTARIQSLEQKQAERLAERGSVGLDEKEMDAVKKNVRFVNRLIARDVFPWDLVLSAIETGMPENIYLESLAPKEPFSKIELKGYATSLSEVSNYLKEKETVDLFRNFELLKIDLEKESETETITLVERDKLPVRFDIVAHLELTTLFPEPVFGSLAQSVLPADKEGS
ncbi:MAG: PilN domain-containing protein [Thermodesulfobacteriota bacterium]